MKKIGIVTILISFLFLSLGWLNLIRVHNKNIEIYEGYLSSAQKNVDDGCYLNAIDDYYLAMSYSSPESICPLVVQAYEKYYESADDDKKDDVYISYLAELEHIFVLCPDDPSYHYIKAELLKENGSDGDAFEEVRYCLDNNLSNDDLMDMYSDFLRIAELGPCDYTDYKTTLNGNYAYLSAGENSKWVAVSSELGILSGEKFNFLSSISDEGYCVTFKDGNSTSQLRGPHGEDGDDNYDPLCPTNVFDYVVEDAGLYNSDSKVINVKCNGEWIYVFTDNDDSLADGFTVASSFQDEEAVVCKNDGSWYALDIDGDIDELDDVQDVKLDLCLNYLQNDVVLAKIDGKYRICDSDFEPLNDFEADNIDLYLQEDSLIAFEDSGKWGFVNVDGDVVIEPQYSEAKSFSNGIAAVKGPDNLWGYINSNNDFVVVDDLEGFMFSEAGYYGSDNKAMVREPDSEYLSVVSLLYVEGE